MMQVAKSHDKEAKAAQEKAEAGWDQNQAPAARKRNKKGGGNSDSILS